MRRALPGARIEADRERERSWTELSRFGTRQMRSRSDQFIHFEFYSIDWAVMPNARRRPSSVHSVHLILYSTLFHKRKAVDACLGPAQSFFPLTLCHSFGVKLCGKDDAEAVDDDIEDVTIRKGRKESTDKGSCKHPYEDDDDDDNDDDDDDDSGDSTTPRPLRRRHISWKKPKIKKHQQRESEVK